MPLKIFAKHVAIALHPLLAFATVATAADLVTLRPKAIVKADVVMLGDLVTGAGAKAGTPLFRAPDVGRIGTIRADAIARAAEELGLKGIETGGLQAVLVSREPRAVTHAELQAAVRATLIKLDASLADATVHFDAPPPALAASGEAPAIEPQAFNLETGAFVVRVAQADAAGVTLTGRIQSLVEVPVLRRLVSRGDVIGPADFAMEARPRRLLASGLLTNPAKLPGVVARRALKAGEAIRESDLAPRDLVERNQKVTIAYERPGMSLTLAGKALASGPAGAVIQVQNVASKRTFDAVVTGEGKVSARLSP